MVCSLLMVMTYLTMDQLFNSKINDRDRISYLKINLQRLGIDEKELDYYERRVREAKMQLESAIYEMEELFEDKYRDVANKIEELEMDLEDIEYERRQ